MFGTDIKVKYYDGIPTSEKEIEDFDEEVDENDI